MRYKILTKNIVIKKMFIVKHFLFVFCFNILFRLYYTLQPLNFACFQFSPWRVFFFFFFFFISVPQLAFMFNVVLLSSFLLSCNFFFNTNIKRNLKNTSNYYLIVRIFHLKKKKKILYKNQTHPGAPIHSHSRCNLGDLGMTWIGAW